MTDEQTLYEAAGGMAFFEQLVDTFYQGVAGDDVLLSLYPEAPDLRGARHRLTLFLAQYWGGPTTYNDERGHPRLRMRHMPFSIGKVERDQWIWCMHKALDESQLDSHAVEYLKKHLAESADFLRNREG